MTSQDGADTQMPDMKSPFSAVPIEITISVGRARPLIRDLLALKKHSVLPLDKRVDDAVELYVGARLIARGQLEWRPYDCNHPLYRTLHYSTVYPRL